VGCLIWMRHVTHEWLVSHTHTHSLSLYTTPHSVIEMLYRIYNCVLSHTTYSYPTHTHTLNATPHSVLEMLCDVTEVWSRSWVHCRYESAHGVLEMFCDVTEYVLWRIWICARRRSDFKYLRLQIGRFSRPLFWVTGTPFYFREKLFESLLTCAKTCLKVTGTPAKTCWKFGSRNYLMSDLFRLWESCHNWCVPHTLSHTHLLSTRRHTVYSRRDTVYSRRHTVYSIYPVTCRDVSCLMSMTRISRTHFTRHNTVYSRYSVIYINESCHTWIM